MSLTRALPVIQSFHRDSLRSGKTTKPVHDSNGGWLSDCRKAWLSAGSSSSADEKSSLRLAEMESVSLADSALLVEAKVSESGSSSGVVSASGGDSASAPAVSRPADSPSSSPSVAIPWPISSPSVGGAPRG